MNQLSIVIPVRFNCRYTIELCLKTIRKYTVYPSYKVVVGNHGVNDESVAFLREQKDIELVDLPKNVHPKDSLQKMIATELFMILHDDVQILKKGWLTKRVKVLLRHPRNAVLGEIGGNFIYGWRQYFLITREMRRFIPLALLMKTEAVREIGLEWAPRGKYDTGGYAYQQFFAQKKYSFVHYPFKYDVKHFWGMTWPSKKKEENSGSNNHVDRWVQVQQDKVNSVRAILDSGKY